MSLGLNTNLADAANSVVGSFNRNDTQQVKTNLPKLQPSLDAKSSGSSDLFSSALSALGISPPPNDLGLPAIPNPNTLMNAKGFNISSDLAKIKAVDMLAKNLMNSIPGKYGSMVADGMDVLQKINEVKNLKASITTNLLDSVLPLSQLGLIEDLGGIDCNNDKPPSPKDALDNLLKCLKKQLDKYADWLINAIKNEYHPNKYIFIGIEASIRMLFVNLYSDGKKLLKDNLNAIDDYINKINKFRDNFSNTLIGLLIIITGSEIKIIGTILDELDKIVNEINKCAGKFKNLVGNPTEALMIGNAISALTDCPQPDDQYTIGVINKIDNIDKGINAMANKNILTNSIKRKGLDAETLTDIKEPSKIKTILTEGNINNINTIKIPKKTKNLNKEDVVNTTVNVLGDKPVLSPTNAGFNTFVKDVTKDIQSKHKVDIKKKEKPKKLHTAQVLSAIGDAVITATR